MMRPKFAHWIDMDWYAFFNNLPHEFYETKNDITTFIINIGVAVQKKRRKDCRLMSEQLISLSETPESLRNIIVSNHAVYTGSSSSGGSGSWRTVFWIIWVVFILIRGVNSCGGDSSNSYKQNFPYYQPQFKLQDSTIMKLFDSNYRKTIYDSSLRKRLDSLLGKRK